MAVMSGNTGEVNVLAAGVGIGDSPCGTGASQAASINTSKINLMLIDVRMFMSPSFYHTTRVSATV